MSAKIGGSKTGKFGTLHIVQVTDDTDIDALMNDYGDMTSGIYGMSARRAQDHSKAKIDFFYNGPENCTMKCLSGNDAVLFCDPLMVESARASADFVCNNGYAEVKIDVRDCLRTT
jgi:cobalt/nickel transport system ATP-binding protein